MSYFDVKTGEIYGALIYLDGQTAVFWTDGRESQVTAFEFGGSHQVTDEAGENRQWVGRFQFVGYGEEHPSAATRRDQLAAYAAGNGGQILDHIDPPAPPKPPSPLDKIREIFRPT